MSLRRGLRKCENGFTLVETLVVLIVLGVLAAIAVPAFLNQRQAARDAALHSDIHGVALEFTQWQHENTNAEFRDLVDGEALYVVSPEADFGYKRYTPGSPTGVRFWEDVKDNSPLMISSGSVVEITVRTDEDRDYKTPENEFCLAASSQSSSYSHSFGGGEVSVKPGGYFEDMLYYDSTQGGVLTIDELSKLKNSETSPCGEHVRAYRAVLAMSNTVL